MSRRKVDLASPAELLRELLGVIYPQNAELPKQIVSADWFWDLSSNSDPKADREAVSTAFKLLIAGLRGGAVQTTGILRGSMAREPIDAADLYRGELNAFAGTLDCSTREAPGRVYSGLVLVLDDVLALAANRPVTIHPIGRLSLAEIHDRAREYFDKCGQSATQDGFMKMLEADGKKFGRSPARAAYKAIAAAHQMTVERGRRKANLPN